MRKFLVPVLTLFCLVLAAPAPAMEVGSPAPDFSLATVDGKTVKLSEFKGRPIILKLATTWCPTCKQQSQAIKSVEDFLAANDVAVVEVFLQDSEKMIRDYFVDRDYAMTHVALIDDGTALKAYNVYLIPRTLLIGPDFVVRRDGSLIEAEDLRSEVKKLLAASD